MSLTPQQSALIERSLDLIEKGLREKIRETMSLPAGEGDGGAAGTVNDFGDEAAASTEQDLNHVLHERYLRELDGIEAVRHRLAAGQVNRCEDCGEEIAYERLLAYPFATRCIECQARREKFGAEAPNATAAR
jgi:RNA polymerase-binding transcription factor DksA